MYGEGQQPCSASTTCGWPIAGLEVQIFMIYVATPWRLQDRWMLALISGGTFICFAGFICCFHLALCSAIFCVAHAADTPIASVTLAVPATKTHCQQQPLHSS